MANIKHLIKGVVSNYGTAPTVAGQAGVAGDLSALKPSNLLEVLTDFAEDFTLFRFYQTLPKRYETSNVATFRQKISRSNKTTTGFVGETERGASADSTFTSKTRVLKYLRQIRKISDISEKMYIDVLDPTQLQIDDAVHDIIEICNKALIFGNSDSNPASFDGVLKQQRDWLGNLNAWYDSNFVIDLRGGVLDVKDVNNGAKIVKNQGFGRATDLYVSTNVKTTLENAFYDKGIVRKMNVDGGKVVEGVQIDTMQTSFGTVKLQPELAQSFAEGVAQTVGQVNLDAPLAVSTVLGSIVPNAFSKFDLSDIGGAGDSFGSYLYGVRGLNKYGEGAMLMNALTVVVGTAGDSVSLAISDTNLVNEATGYVIYRSLKDDVGANALMFPILELGVADLANGFDGGIAGSVLDNNRFLPKTEIAMLVQADKNTWEEAILKDYDMSIEFYAKTSPSREVSVSRGETPLLYHPYRFVTFLNLGGVS